MVDLTKLSKRRLAEMWCELNIFKVPTELKDVISTDTTESDPESLEWMRKIEEIVPHNQCLWVWREQRGLTMKGDGVLE